MENRGGDGAAGETTEREDGHAHGPPSRVWERWSDWQELLGCLKQELELSESVLARSGRRPEEEVTIASNEPADNVADAIRCLHVIQLGGKGVCEDSRCV